MWYVSECGSDVVWECEWCVWYVSVGVVLCGVCEWWVWCGSGVHVVEV